MDSTDTRCFFFNLMTIFRRHLFLPWEEDRPSSFHHSSPNPTILPGCSSGYADNPGMSLNSIHYQFSKPFLSVQVFFFLFWDLTNFQITASVADVEIIVWQSFKWHHYYIKEYLYFPELLPQRPAYLALPSSSFLKHLIITWKLTLITNLINRYCSRLSSFWNIMM